MPPLVSFISDFGLADPYAGTVKAVMLGICPGLTVVDVTHDVQPQAVIEAVFLAQQAWPYFPNGTIHLAVVDPGVGTDRRPIALQTPQGYAVGPDNGVLSAALPAFIRRSASVETERGSLNAFRMRAPAGYEARSIESPDVRLPQISATFHGRDVFGPAAAHLAAGYPFENIGPPCSDMIAIPAIRGVACSGGVRGRIIHIDRFGNLISSIHGDDLLGPVQHVEILGRSIPVVRTYGDRPGLVALVGSAGYLEIAVANGSALRELRVGLAEKVTAWFE
jgi:S-adenosylmethionine hydrolase